MTETVDCSALGANSTLERERPEFSQAFHGYRSSNEWLADAEHRGLLQLQNEGPSGGYVGVRLGEAI